MSKGNSTNNERQKRWQAKQDPKALRVLWRERKRKQRAKKKIVYVAEGEEKDVDI
jgi:hypothetical protein